MYIIIRNKNKMLRLKENQILYFKVDQRKILAHYEGGVMEFYSSMKDLELIFKDKKYIKCHSSYMVAEEKIMGLNVTGNKYVITLTNGEQLPVTNTYQKSIKMLFPKTEESSIMLM